MGGKANAEQRRKYKLKFHYKMAVDTYDRLEMLQGAVCAICQKPNSTDRKLAVDHDHKTGIRRLLLCDLCNRALGQFKDDVELLKRAVSYLEVFNELQSYNRQEAC